MFYNNVFNQEDKLNDRIFYEEVKEKLHINQSVLYSKTKEKQFRKQDIRFYFKPIVNI